MTTTKRIVFWISVAFEFAIWPVGILLMLEAPDADALESIGKAMATLALGGFIPMFWSTE